MIAIIDYGLGNLHSAVKGVERVAGDQEVILTEDPAVVDRASRVVLPGVGAFGDTMKGLRERNMIPALQRVFDDGRPYLGICMGMQALFAGSEETPGVEGLGVFKTTLKKFPKSDLKVPHMGWNALEFPQPCDLFKGLDSGAHVYFVHSYYADPEDDPTIAASITQHGLLFASAVAKPPIFGTQFHPEKSQAVGLKILENFVSL